jgi:TRAP-type mannitol/chloroaromatic compound transport system permease large subunit
MVVLIMNPVVYPDRTMADVYKGVTAFISLQILGVVIICIWPEFITYLPSVFFGDK